MQHGNPRGRVDLMPRMRIFVGLAVLAIVGAMVPQFTFAASDACVDNLAPSNDVGPTLLSVTSTLSFLTTPPPEANCLQNPGTYFHSDAATCGPQQSVGVVAGAYCSAIVGAAAVIRCMWALDTVPPTEPTRVYAGWDKDLDGKILQSSGESVMGPMENAPDGLNTPQYLFTNPVAGNSRLILFPTNIQSETTHSGDRSLIGCL